MRALLVVAALCVSTGCASSGPTSSASALTASHNCADTIDFTCSTLRVPLDPSGATAGTLDLQVAVSDTGDSSRGTVLLLSGGPGEPGIPFVPGLYARLRGALTGYRFVAFDPRGTGATALDCPALQDEMGFSDLTVPSASAVTACGAAIGPQRRYYATADTVADIELLRQAIGAQQLVLDGVSYGTYVAERYALAYPRHVAKLILDSVVPQQNVDPFDVASMQAVARVLRAVCVQQRCPSDPAQDVATIVRTRGDGPQLLDTLVALSIGVPQLSDVPGILRAAATGRPAALDQLIGDVHQHEAAFANQLSQGLHASTLCADIQMPWGGSDTTLAARGAALRHAAGQLPLDQVFPFDRATAAGNGFVQTCLYWPPAQPAALAPSVNLPAVPVLLLSGSEDLSTPQVWAEQEATHAPRAQLVIVPGTGHSVQYRAAGNPALPIIEKFLHGS